MRIDSSRNMLVGTTTVGIASTTSQGLNVLGQYGAFEASRNNASLFLNRLTSDGDIAVFRKDGTTVGRIGTSGGDKLTIGNGDVGVAFNPNADSIYPWNTATNAARDGVVDLGYSDGGSTNIRFRDLYLSGSVKVPAASKGIEYSSTAFITPENNVSGAEISTPGAFVVKTGSTPAERMRIDSSGNVGIGTSSPSSALDLGSGDLRFTGGAGQDIAWGSASVDYAAIRRIDPASQDVGLSFHTTTNAGVDGAPERMRIDASGNVGIGTSGLYSGTPTLKGKLRLSKHSVTQDGGLEFVATDFSNGYGWRVQSNDYGSGDTRLSFFSRSNSASWTERVKFNENGSAYNSTGTWGSLSDGTLKENVRPSTSQWEDIKALNIVNYSFIEDSLDSPDKIGVIAQELEESGMEGLVETGGDGIKTVKYSVMHTKALKALQEAMVRIETLEVRITELENN